MENLTYSIRLLCVAVIMVPTLSCSKSAADKTREVYTVIPDTTWGAVLVKGDPATGAVSYKVTKEQVEEVLRVRRTQKDWTEKSEARTAELLSKDWLTRNEYGTLFGGSALSDGSNVCQSIGSLSTDLGGIAIDVREIKERLREPKQ